MNKVLIGDMFETQVQTTARLIIDKLKVGEKQFATLLKSI